MICPKISLNIVLDLLITVYNIKNTETNVNKLMLLSCGKLKLANVSEVIIACVIRTMP